MAIEIKDTEIFPYRKINDELDKNAVEYEHQSRFMIDFNFGGSVWCVDSLATHTTPNS